MTNEELVQAYQSGNHKALDQLLEDNKGMVYLVARKYYGYCIATLDIEDLIQEGYLGLMEAVERYDFNNSKKAMFTSYAIFWIRQRISRYGKYRSRKKEDVSIHTPIGEDLEIGDTLPDQEDCICKVEDSIYFQELKNEIHEAMRENLTLRQRKTIELRYGLENTEPATLQEIANIFSVNISYIRDVELNALRKLRKSKWGRMKWLEIQEERYFT